MKRLNKIILIIVIIGLVVLLVGGVSLGIWWSLRSSQPPDSGLTADERVEEVLVALSSQTGIGFGKGTAAQFEWRDSQGNSQTVTGRKVEASGLNTSQVQTVDDFANYFPVSLDNVSDGTVVGRVGYRVDAEVVCVVDKKISGFDPNNPVGFDETKQYPTDVVFQCGVLL